MANYDTPVTNLLNNSGDTTLMIASDFLLLDAAYNWTTQYNAYPINGSGLYDPASPFSTPANLPSGCEYVAFVLA